MIGKDNFAEADNLFFLPETKRDFSSVDILLVTGDAYLDHPSFGIAIIARVLESAGYSVAIWSQPDYRNAELLKKLPEVRLFIGITAGNIDSVVSNYTGTRSRRKDDAYSIDGNPLFPQGHQKRPDRATIVYTSFLKQRYKNIPIVLGGIEASLRRFAHYDYVQDKIRHSVLLDSKADIISYGMGEKSMIEIANRIKEKQSLKGIEGTVIKIKPEECEGLTALPSYEEIINDKEKLLEMTALIEANMVHETACGLYQKDGTNIVASFRPQPLLTQKELDDVYALPFRRNFPEYCERVPAWKMIQHSVTSHRGCFGRCSFCAIASHQGPLVSRRSEESIIAEVKKIALLENFHGTISDIGGPTANMYASFCKIGGCKDPKCLFPSICPNLQMNQADYVDLLFKVKNLPEVKHVFINSGIRYDMA
ncbi:MAG: YgiQ family radical SAM protein, partial [Spirochaetales bacterium]|nr:YgiQ family radical SAM protein [Spirochaetales bacterium]